MDDGLRDRWLQEAQRRMARAGMRAGAARTTVVALLARDGQCLVSAQEITSRLAGGAAGSAASVYRALEDLHTLGLLHRVYDDDGIARFEIADPAGRHHHFVDEQTGAIEPFVDPRLEEAIAATGRRLGIELTGHEVTLRGRRR
jgi:Fur family ferric uptake transcriptional regulator